MIDEGRLRKKIFEKYEQIKNLDGINIGWELIRQHFCEDHVTKICSEINPQHLLRIKFLKPEP
jgi:hypothetical protein